MKLHHALLASAAAGALALVVNAPAWAQAPAAGLLARIAGIQLAPAAAGMGSGSWIIPTDVVGDVDAILEDSTGTQVFQLEASLTRFIASGATRDEEGGLYGELLAVDRTGALVSVADVEGRWIQHTNGTGSVAALIRVRTGDPKNPLVVVGSVDGYFAAPTLHGRNPSSPGKVYLRWRLFA